MVVLQEPPQTPENDQLPYGTVRSRCVCLPLDSGGLLIGHFCATTAALAMLLRRLNSTDRVCLLTLGRMASSRNPLASTPSWRSSACVLEPTPTPVASKEGASAALPAPADNRAVAPSIAGSGLRPPRLNLGEALLLNSDAS
mmetsp:Transcript_58423/g.107854  ORF Transcript_58423/g.107854 Transcript_58423/m.107854 type:complete len:142 (-) Transcript_58423:524-949(-)